MQPRVTAILIAHGGGEYLERTLASLSRQSRRPDVTIVIDTAPTDASNRTIAAAAPTLHLTARPGATFGAAVAQAQAQALTHSGDADGANEWLWLLGEDNTADPTALENLLHAVEIAPSVVAAGPKLLSVDDPTLLLSLGETISTLGATVHLVENELDQAQYDTHDDVLGIAAEGMLVRRDAWQHLGGFDPGLPSIDASLDFSIRARLAGHRVVVVPAARMASVGGPELFGRASASRRRRFRVARAAQLHRRLTYAPAWAVPLHWLSLLPLAAARSIGHLIAKRPTLVAPELAAGLAAVVDTGVAGARSNLRRGRTLGWAAIEGLRMPTSEVRERRAQQAEALAIARAGGIPRAPRTGFVSGGGLWVLLAMALTGIIAYGPLFGATAITGGKLLPLSSTAAELWANTGIGWRATGLGEWGAADPFATVLAVLGSLTFWAPGLALIALWFVALPLASLGAWMLARRVTHRRWLPTLAGIAWPLAGPLLAALADGDPAAALVHVALPWLALLALSAARSWAAAAGVALVLALVGASAPVLVPALLVVWVIFLATNPKSVHRLLFIPVPLAVLFAPLVIDQVRRGNPLALLADPGHPVARETVSAWHLAVGDVNGSWLGWTRALEWAGLPVEAAPIVVAALVAPLVLLALLSMFLPGAARALVAMIVALLGFVTAVAAGQLFVSAVGDSAVAVGASSGTSLYVLGLIVAALIALDSLGRAAEPLGALAGLAAVAVALPALLAMLIGVSDAGPGNGRTLPALVGAVAAQQPEIGTLLIAAAGDGIAVDVQRGAGTTLDDASTLEHTALALDENGDLARIAGNLAFSSGFDASEELARLGIGFVVVAPEGEPTVRSSVVGTLNSNQHLTPVGESIAGELWRLDAPLDFERTQATPAETAWASSVTLITAIVFGIVALLALPFGGVRAPRAERSSDDPADTFDGSDDE